MSRSDIYRAWELWVELGPPTLFHPMYPYSSRELLDLAAVGHNLTTQDMLDVVNQLRPAHRDLLLDVASGMSLTEIGAGAGVSRQAVSQRWLAALDRVCHPITLRKIVKAAPIATPSPPPTVTATGW